MKRPKRSATTLALVPSRRPTFTSRSGPRVGPAWPCTPSPTTLQPRGAVGGNAHLGANASHPCQPSFQTEKPSPTTNFGRQTHSDTTTLRRRQSRPFTEQERRALEVEAAPAAARPSRRHARPHHKQRISGDSHLFRSRETRSEVHRQVSNRYPLITDPSLSPIRFRCGCCCLTRGLAVMTLGPLHGRLSMLTSAQIAPCEWAPASEPY